MFCGKKHPQMAMGECGRDVGYGERMCQACFYCVQLDKVKRIEGAYPKKR